MDVLPRRARSAAGKGRRGPDHPDRDRPDRRPSDLVALTGRTDQSGPPGRPVAVPAGRRLPTPSRVAAVSTSVLVGERTDLLRAVESVTAALTTPPPTTLAPMHLPARWSTAGAVLITVDAAPAVAELGLPARDGVHLLGTETDAADLCRWSAPLGASLVVVPRDTPVLGRALGGAPPPEGARTLAVVSGGGGAGASTTAAGLAGAAARDGGRAVLVDLDPWAGGIDLLVGTERATGWRWDDLARARGGVGSLAGRLPHGDGVDVITMGRTPGVRLPDDEAVDSVLAAARATYDLVVLDVTLTPPWEQHLARAGTVLVVAGAGVRQLASARQVALRCAGEGMDPRIIARGGGPGPTGGVDQQLVAETLGFPVIGLLPHDPRLPVAAERGDPPWRVARRDWVAACTRLLDTLEIRRRGTDR
ncbi:septum site-determining protein Ssd [Raineyella sp.]|uniref:septum site-determining protein Ssd n=1 Tax=Raineyella sp. TaxID=1911550 RepID=UPI002B1F4CBE|nr:septum site-determining protein Ssd [Raineyella sp.]MEA5153845.1 septum site-determining protein Ssd [Raineyella sp.]